MSAAASTRTPLKAIFSIFKRGMKGVYQHCAEKHLHRYLADFEFRYQPRSERLRRFSTERQRVAGCCWEAAHLRLNSQNDPQIVPQHAT